MYNYVMTPKSKKTKSKKPGTRTRRIAALHASMESDLFSLATEPKGGEARWNRPRKQRISLRLDCEVVDWLKSKGPGYQTRINRMLRKVMLAGGKPTGGRR